MFRHTKFSSPLGRGKKGMKLVTAGAGNTDPANGGGKAIMYGGANLDAVSPAKLASMVKTQEGDYARPNIDHGYGEDQDYGQPHLFDKFHNPVTKKKAGGLIDRQYQTDGNPRATWSPNSRDAMDYGVKTKYKDGELSPIESLYKYALGGLLNTPGPGKPIFPVESWKSQGITRPDTLSMGTMFRMSPADQNRIYKTPVPNGADPNGIGFMTAAPGQENPNAIAERMGYKGRVNTFDIAGGLAGTNHPQGANVSFAKGGLFSGGDDDIKQKAALLKQRQSKRDSVRQLLTTRYPNDFNKVNNGMLDYYQKEPSTFKNLSTPHFAKGGWIQGAVNPEHKGYCTPMTKSTCTGARRRFALTMKKHHGFHEKGGALYNASQLEVAPPAQEYMNRQDGKNPHIPGYKSGGKLTAIRKKPGGSNVGKKHFANGKKRTGPYVGPSGGAPAGSYPVPDIGHARAALRLAGHAPNPGGIRAAVHRKFPQLAKKCTGGSMRFSAGSSAWKGGKAYG